MKILTPVLIIVIVLIGSCIVILMANNHWGENTGLNTGVANENKTITYAYGGEKLDVLLIHAVGDMLRGKISLGDYIKQVSHGNPVIVLVRIEDYILPEIKVVETDSSCKIITSDPPVIFKARVLENIYGGEDLVGKEINIKFSGIFHSKSSGKLVFYEFSRPIFKGKEYVILLVGVEDKVKTKVFHVCKSGDKIYDYVDEVTIFNDKVYKANLFATFLYKGGKLYHLYMPKISNIDSEYNSILGRINLNSFYNYTGNEPIIVKAPSLTEFKEYIENTMQKQQ